METDAKLNLDYTRLCSEFVLEIGFKKHPSSTMVSPFLANPFNPGARTVRGCLRMEKRVFRDRSNPLAFSDNILHEHYRFSVTYTNLWSFKGKTLDDR